MKLLTFNLSKNKISESLLEKHLLKTYIGGRGLGDKILYDSGYTFHPLSPESILLFMVGPLTGKTLFSGRHCIMGKSPLTNMISNAMSGGFFGAELASCNIIGVKISGRSKHPSYIMIEDDDYTIKDASHLWSLDTFATQEKIEKDESNAKVACIGPAGEHQVKFACVMNDKYHAAARCGFGCVMGSKNLKAIAVKSNQSKEAPLNAVEKSKLSSFNKLYEHGSSWGIEKSNEVHALPIRNFQEGYSDQLLNYNEKLKRLHVKNYGCYLCPIRCDKIIEIEYNSKRIITSKPDYESIACLGPNNQIYDPVEISYFAHLCNLLGLDVISTGGTIAFYLEYCEKKIRNPKFRFGDSPSIIKLINMIALKEGVGSLLAEGSKRASEKLNALDLAMHVNGLELPGYNPFTCYGTSLGYITSTKGACHTRSYPLCVGEAVNHLISAESYHGKAVLVKCHQDLNAIMDSLILCIFSSQNIESSTTNKIKKLFKSRRLKMDIFLRILDIFPSLLIKNFKLKNLEELLYQNTGIKFTNLYKRGAKIYNMERIMNQNLMRTAKLPPRFPQNRSEEFQLSLQRYLKLREADTILEHRKKNYTFD